MRLEIQIRLGVNAPSRSHGKEPAQSDNREPGHADKPHEHLIPAAARQQRAVLLTRPRGQPCESFCTPVKPLSKNQNLVEIGL